MEPFFHKWHRVNYALQDQELKQVQFYISTEILARNLSPEAKGTAESIVIVPERTPGVATEVGPDWVRVSFREGAEGVLFIAVAGRSGSSAYWLATEVPGARGLFPVKDLQDKAIRIRGTTFKLVHGSNARLLINSEDLRELIDQRTHIPGRAQDSD
jgi:hypothetical protein